MPLMKRPPHNTSRGPVRSARRPVANIATADTTWNRATARPRSLRAQPNSSTIGLSVRPTAKRAPPLVNSTKNPEISMSAALVIIGFRGKELIIMGSKMTN